MARRLSWSPAAYARFRDARLRPAKDLLDKVGKLTAASSLHILDAGCGSGLSSRLLIDTYPHAKLTCIDSSPTMIEAARSDEALASRQFVHFEERSIEDACLKSGSGELYDMIFANSVLQWVDEREQPLPTLLERMLSRVRPGGALAVQIPDTSAMPSHAILRELADERGLPAAALLRANCSPPAAYFEALLGPLCQTLDAWQTTYMMRLEGEEAVFDYVRSAALLPLLDALGGHESDAAVDFEAAYRERLRGAYPAGPDGRTLYPFTRFFVVARRPSLLDVYSEYAAYHDHQLTKGWKS